MQNWNRIAIDVAVNVSAAQRDDQQPVRVKLTETLDAFGASPSMQRNHKIRVGSIVVMANANRVPQGAQDPRPAQACCVVAGP